MLRQPSLWEWRALGVDDFGIDQDEFRLGIFFEGYVDDGNAAADADLRGGEADTVGDVHGLEHVFDEFLEFVVEDGDSFGAVFRERGHRILRWDRSCDGSIIRY